MNDLNINVTPEMIEKIAELRKQIPPDEVYLILWVLVELWTQKDIRLLELDRIAFLNVISDDPDSARFSAWVAELYESIEFDLDGSEESSLE